MISAYAVSTILSILGEDQTGIHSAQAFSPSNAELIDFPFYMNP